MNLEKSGDHFTMNLGVRTASVDNSCKVSDAL